MKLLSAKQPPREEALIFSGLLAGSESSLPAAQFSQDSGLALALSREQRPAHFRCQSRRTQLGGTERRGKCSRRFEATARRILRTVLLAARTRNRKQPEKIRALPLALLCASARFIDIWIQGRCFGCVVAAFSRFSHFDPWADELQMGELHLLT